MFSRSEARRRRLSFLVLDGSCFIVLFVHASMLLW